MVYFIVLTILAGAAPRVHNPAFIDFEASVKYAKDYAEHWNGDIIILKEHYDPYTKKPNEARIVAVVRPGSIQFV